MGNRLQDGAIGLTKGLASRALGGARFTRDTHPEMMPVFVTPEISASQEKLKKFVDRFAITSLFDGSDPDRIEAEASVAAFSLVDEGLVSKQTMVEIRPLVPFESLFDHNFNQAREKTIKQLGALLTDQYSIKAISNPTPIIPSDTSEEGADLTHTWDVISGELERFRYQTIGEAELPAVVAVTNSYYAKRLFAGSIGFQGHRLERNDLLTLRSVGRHPRENLLLGPTPSYVLESKLLAAHHS